MPKKTLRSRMELASGDAEYARRSASLTVLEDGLEILRRDVTDLATFRIGRSDECEITLRDPLCDAEHAQFAQGSSGWSVRDLDSLNGVFLNGKAITSTRQLRSGDVIRLSSLTEVRLAWDEPSLPPAISGLTPSHDCSIYTWVPEKRTPGVEPASTLRARRFEHNILRKAKLDGLPVEELYQLGIKLFQLAGQGDPHISLDETLAERTLQNLQRLTGAQSLGVCILERGSKRVAEGGTVLHLGEAVPTDALDAAVAEVAATGLTVWVSVGVPLQEHGPPRTLIVAPVEWDMPLARREKGWRRETVRVLYLFGSDLTASDADIAALASKSYATSSHALTDRCKKHDHVVEAVWAKTQFLGRSPAIEKIKESAILVAPTDLAVLIQGETGTGKEILAQEIHRLSRRGGRMVPLNCAAIPESLVESELFGHERGSFTGAEFRRVGAFESAHDGTLFLDEIGEMPLRVQAKLLRVLENATVTTIGGRPIEVNVRVIAATHCDLQAMVQAGSFREDLYYRLAVVPFDVPPLRRRLEDLPELLDEFLARALKACPRPPLRWSKSALQLLRDSEWPGNVRQVENFVKSLVAMLPPQTTVIERPVVESKLKSSISGSKEALPEFDLWRATNDLHYVAKQVRACGTKKAAAEAMGFSREGLSKLCRRHFEAYPRLLDDPELEILTKGLRRKP